MELHLAIIEAWQAGANRLKKAARFWGIAEVLFRVWGTMWRFDDSKSEITAAREQLGEETFSTAWAEGGQMTFDQAIAYALEGNIDSQRDADI